MGSDWFTVENCTDGVFALSEYRHPEKAHSYLVSGRERAALIDTGLGIADISAVVARLNSLPVTVLTTHAHWDHTGGHRYFHDIAAHRLEVPWLSGSYPLPRAAVLGQLTVASAELPADFSAADYRIYDGGVSRALEDGDTVELGGRRLLAVHTPGHSPGHLCFFEPDLGLLFSGDLVYAGCLYAFFPTTDPAAYADSLEKLSLLPVQRVFPAHNSLDVTPSLIARERDAFAQLRRDGALRHGAGCFDFGDFSVKL